MREQEKGHGKSKILNRNKEIQHILHLTSSSSEKESQNHQMDKNNNENFLENDSTDLKSELPSDLCTSVQLLIGDIHLERNNG